LNPQEFESRKLLTLTDPFKCLGVTINNKLSCSNQSCYQYYKTKLKKIKSDEISKQ